ncbi:MAG TPA: XTP/dITP diphosphatase [Candidatus Ornithomonoglobus merdipullorum]|uniref:dITP/XTP pyrophosphatase n=1 Tax=Candidatus Ornithomonoglobus merdipullorum TaxID=2840895 RepID=A0A9D1MAJ1_9FIRM|nr:XTP/dITP diphosphatase [Candidatus Ornithomonoglobus merdipullorum]
MNIVVATKNKNKVFEIARIFEPLGFTVMSQEDAGIDVDVEETGNTFAKNALIKARAVAMLCDDCVLADDSGLCVEALDGRPGVYSARYAGPGASDMEKIEKLLIEMQDKTNRKAKFVTNIAFIFPDGREIVTQGEVCGRILREPAGENGFGYDPIFYSDELEKTFAQAEPDEKNAISHRGRALSALYDEIKNMLDEE